MYIHILQKLYFQILLLILKAKKKICQYLLHIFKLPLTKIHKKISETLTETTFSLTHCIKKIKTKAF